MKAAKFPALTFLFGGRKKKLRVGAGRRVTAPSSDFDDMSEPNMKLSRALLVVLLLHVVAVAGIIAFNAIKSRQATPPSALATSSARSPTKPQPSASVPRDAQKFQPFISTKSDKKVKSADTSLPEGAKYYTVAKGDSPASIAKKFKVSYSDLLAANHIDDARKLQVGQKLIIPPRKQKKN